MSFKQRLHCWFVMEGCVIHNDKAVGTKFWHQHFAHPCGNSVVCAAAFKQHGCDPLVATLRHDEVRALAVVTTDSAMHFLATLCPSMWSVALCGESAFIKINDVVCAVLLHPLTKCPQIFYSATGMTFRVPRRFFYGCPSAATQPTRRSRAHQNVRRVRAATHPDVHAHAPPTLLYPACAGVGHKPWELRSCLKASDKAFYGQSQKHA